MDVKSRHKSMKSSVGIWCVWGWGIIMGCVFVGKRRALGASGLEVGVGPGLKPNQF